MEDFQNETHFQLCKKAICEYWYWQGDAPGRLSDMRQMLDLERYGYNTNKPRVYHGVWLSIGKAHIFSRN